MTPINIVLAIAAAFLLLGIIGEQDREKNKNITVAFVAVVALIAVLNTIA